jgi:hypothetical protein
MSATGFLDACGFLATSSGTGSFVVNSALTGYQTPASAGAVNATVYSYRAESTDKTQWEEGFGAYTVSGTTLARTTITANYSGGTSAISFSAAPNVFITALSQDLQNFALLKGTATNDSANSGFVGEFVSSNVASGSAVSTASGTVANITSISLTAGDWDCSATVSTTPLVNMTDFRAWISTTSATDPGAPNSGAYVEEGTRSTGVTLNASYSYSVGTIRMSLSTTTTVYLSFKHTASGSNTAYGFISARRVR